jgi:hypothetical protein
MKNYSITHWQSASSHSDSESLARQHGLRLPVSLAAKAGSESVSTLALPGPGYDRLAAWKHTRPPGLRPPRPAAAPALRSRPNGNLKAGRDSREARDPDRERQPGVARLSRDRPKHGCRHAAAASAAADSAGIMPACQDAIG